MFNINKKIFIVFAGITFCHFAFAVQLEFLAEKTLQHKQVFEKTKIGGLSGIWFDSESSKLYSISDDRGSVNDPRYYVFNVSIKPINGKIDFQVSPVEVQTIKDHAETLDMEGIVGLPWGSLLISSEGDLNHKPRVPPELIDVRRDEHKKGVFVKKVALPEKFMPELTGKQTKGVRNNLAFEGLTGIIDKNIFWAFMEAPLMQDSKTEVGLSRILQLETGDAFQLKPTKEFLYQTEDKFAGSDDIILPGHVSEALAIGPNEFLVLERSVRLTVKGPGFFCQIFRVTTAEATDVSAIESLQQVTPEKLKTLKIAKKELVLNLDSIKSQLGGEIDNFEGMSFGPAVDGKKSIILVSDDNFRKMQKTQFVLLRFIE